MLSYKNKCFTLAEVITTISILGIVAAITIPSIVHNYQEKAAVVKLKKVYAQLQQAFDLSYVLYGGSPTNWSNSLCSAQEVNNHLKNCTKIDYIYSGIPKILLSNMPPDAGNCAKDPNNNGNDVIDECYLKGTERIKDKAGYTIDTWAGQQASANITRYLSKDGTFIAIEPTSNNIAINNETFPYSINIVIDINGKKAPNRWGYDIFKFVLVEKGIFPLGGENNNSYNHKNYCAKSNSSGTGCARWVIEKGNMNYLRENTNW